MRRREGLRSRPRGRTEESSERRSEKKENEVRYDEHHHLGCRGNRRIPGRVRADRLLLPVPPSSRVRDLNSTRGAAEMSRPANKVFLV